MRKSSWTPSIVPNDEDQNVYLVVDDFAHRGRAWREADIEKADLKTVVAELLAGQYNDPIRVVGFNTAEKWPGIEKVPSGARWIHEIKFDGYSLPVMRL
jgi:hypothetical protein